MCNIVVDTNVFVHSCNPSNGYFGEAVEFLQRLKDSSFTVFVDEGMNADEAQNRSRIWSEYLNHIPQASVAREVIAELLASNRISDVDTDVSK